MYSFKIQLISSARYHVYYKSVRETDGYKYCAWNALECVVGDSLLGHILFGVIIITLYVIKCCSYILCLFHNSIALFNDTTLI